MEMSGSLPPDVHIAMYRIAQEAMNNIARHANASSLVVDLAGTESRIILRIIDDGYGFDNAVTSPGGMGMDIMQERADEVGAQLVVSSEQDIGTTVEVTWTAEKVSREA
jgi:signal transduction histidine kinase